MVKKIVEGWWGKTTSQIESTDLFQRVIYEFYCGFIVHFYIIPEGPYKGQTLAYSTVIKYVSAIISLSWKLF